MVTARIHKIEIFLSAKNSVEPLLRSPFSGGQLSISRLKSGWTEFPLIPQRHLEVRDLILDARIGGSFWKPAEKLPRNSRAIVIFPSDMRRARRLWEQVIAWHNAESLLIVYPPSRALKPLLRKITEVGASMTPSADPYPVLDIANRVYADAFSDLGSLAAMADLPSFQLNDDGFDRISPHHISARLDDGTVYTNPYTSAPACIEEISEILGDWRRMFTHNRSIGVCAGVSLWKRRRIKQLLHTGEKSPPFRRSVQAIISKAASQGSAIGAWATRIPATLESRSHKQNIPLIRIEDGFIRSFGLGSALTAPASIVADQRGIYFDPARPSDLEILLADTVFSVSIKQRAARLIDLLTANYVSKYGFGGEAPTIEAKPDQRIILVPGQVADDLSLKLGGCGPVRTNEALLAQVRQRNPDAFIVYRPHPDVEAGYRQGAIGNPVTCGLADQLIAGGSIAALIGVADEVHTITSLAGFEGLLRGLKVETYGQPFYAGWGLTKDHAPLARRQRRLQIEELAAGTLILYPNYIDPATGLLCGPETLIARLAQPELWRPNMLMRLKQLEGKFRRSWARRPQFWTRSNA